MFFITAVSPLASYGISTYSLSYSNFSIDIYTTLIGPASSNVDTLKVTVDCSCTDTSAMLTVFPVIFISNGYHDYTCSEHMETYGILKNGQKTTWTFGFRYEDLDKASHYDVTFALYEKGTNINTGYPIVEVSSTFYTSGGTYQMKNSVEPRHLYYQYSTLEKETINWESYNFSRLSGGLSPENSNELNYTDTFMYSPGDLGSYDESLFENAYIAVVDYANLYPNITKDLGEYTFRLDVDISRPDIEGDYMDVSLSPLSSDKYYVNKSTLEMYSGAKPLSDNYQETTSFYIPRGKQEEAANNEYILVFEGVGYNKATLYKYLTYYTSKEHFGANCVTSEYCIIGKRYD
ncbi:MAG: hypothetical protein LUC16_02845 [Coprobacillus sp.]|nr:hypothetical protein [Coprobacillus sp.]